MTGAREPLVEPDARILVINVARIGDTLLTTPVALAIKQACPRGRLGCLLHPRTATLFEGLPCVDHLGTITPKTAVWRGRFHARRWDYAIVYGRDAPLIRYAARVAARVVAFRHPDERINRLLWKAVLPPAKMLHAVHERLLLTSALGIEAVDYRLRYRVSSAEGDWAHKWIQARLPAAARPLIGLQVSSFPTKAYRDWPVEYFVQLGRRIVDAYPKAYLLVLGDDRSKAKASWVANQLGGRSLPVAGELALRESAALMSCLDAYVGVDTGPTHIAGALGIPMVVLYHCFHRGRYLAPLGHENLRVIEHPVSDSDCQRTMSMSEISVATVWRHVQELLDKRLGARRSRSMDSDNNES